MVMKKAHGFHTPLQQLLLLEERIRLAGARLPEDVDQHKRFHGIKCTIRDTDCLVDIRLVSEVIEDKYVTPIPSCVDWIEGVMNYRGALVAVYNVNRFLHEDSEKQPGPLIILRYANELTSIRVDNVLGMQKYMLDEFKEKEESSEDVEALDYYINASIESDDKTWHRFDVIKLLDEMTGRDPRIRHTTESEEPEEPEDTVEEQLSVE